MLNENLDNCLCQIHQSHQHNIILKVNIILCCWFWRWNVDSFWMIYFIFSIHMHTHHHYNSFDSKSINTCDKIKLKADYNCPFLLLLFLGIIGKKIVIIIMNFELKIF